MKNDMMETERQCFELLKNFSRILTPRGLVVLRGYCRHLVSVMYLVNVM